MMRKIKLLGKLGQKFGREFYFDISSVAEAIQALIANFKGFAAYLIESDAHGIKYRVVVDGSDRGENELTYPVGSGTIVILPVVRGSGAVWRIVAGTVLVGVGLFTGIPFVTLIGASLILGGISELLTPVPKQNNYLFSNPTNTTNEGNPVPIAYGTVMAGSHLISASISISHDLLS